MPNQADLPTAPHPAASGRSYPLWAAVVIAAATALAPAPSQASSEEAWAEFRTQVEEACRALLSEMPGEATLLVNPFGSESYGAAVVSVKGESGSDRMICIYDKRSGSAELTAPFSQGS